VASRRRTDKVSDERGTISSLYTHSSATVPSMREEPRRIDGRLEGTLRIPDGEPRGIAVIAHPLPTHGGTMRNPLIAAIARAAADRGLYALRFNFRGTEGSAVSDDDDRGGHHAGHDFGERVELARALMTALD